MPIYHIHLTTPIRRTFRTEQVAGLFDLALDDLAAERIAHTLTAELPGLDEDWTIGAIVGPSGSGKSTLARAAYGAAVHEPEPWPEDVAIIDALETGTPLPLKRLLRVLTAVGLASPPSWLKPYRVLSTGERFRADLARALLNHSEIRTRRRGDTEEADAEQIDLRASAAPRETISLLVLDEFTSTLDRTVACTASHALAKYLRSKQEPGAQASLAPDSWPLAPLRFIALSCHADFLPWLAPDWILDLANHQGQMTSDQGLLRPTWPRGSLQRSELRLRVARVPQKLWPRFARHHYLSGGLSSAATCYAAFVSEASPIAFCAVLATLGWKRTKRITRLVVLPEFQGLGIGPRLAETVAAAQASQGNRVTITASHPSVLAWCSRSPRWRYLGLKKTGSTRQQLANRPIRCSTGRAVASFEWVGVSGE